MARRSWKFMLAVLLFFIACRESVVFAKGVVPDKEILEKKAEQALQSLKENYERKDLQGFFRGVSDEATFDVSDLRFQLSSRFSNFGSLELAFFTDKTLVEGQKVLFKTHWQRRMVNNQTGQVETNEGSADWTFEVGETVEWVAIRGDSPF